MPTLKPNLPPPGQKIYHITHLDNLPSLASCGCLWSDAEMLRQEVGKTAIGMPEIKRRRLEKIEVECHAGTKVGEYVPFYFCPRSVMLIKYYYNNDPNLPHREGQRPIVHLEADLQEVVQWADAQSRKWAFSTSNAGAFYPDFYRCWNDLSHINWQAVAATDFRDPQTQNEKQAEFLLYESFPWQMFKVIGVKDNEIKDRVERKLLLFAHFPDVRVLPQWYY